MDDQQMMDQDEATTTETPAAVEESTDAETETPAWPAADAGADVETPAAEETPVDPAV